MAPRTGKVRGGATGALSAMLMIAGVVLVTLAWPTGRSEGQSVPEKSIDAVLRQHAGLLMSVPGVVGAAEGLCDGRPCIKVFVARRTADVLRAIPGTLEGYPVVVEETGEIRPLRPPGR